MTELSQEEVLKIAKECGIDGLNPMGFYMTDIRLEWLERFAAAIYSKGFAAGAEVKLEDVRHMLTDRATGATAAYDSDDTSDYWEGRMDEANLSLDAILSISITPTNKGEQDE